MDGQFADLPGVRLFYLDTGGSGETVIFLHANTGTSASFAPQLRAFADAGHRAIAFDARGCGMSTPEGDGSPQPATVAEDLEALIGHLGIENLHLVGVARGGFWALYYATWHPERVLSVTFGATLLLPDEPEIRDFAARIRVEALWEHQHAAALELSPTYRGEDPAGTNRWLEIHDCAHQPGAPAQWLRSPNTYEKLESITAPVFAIAGGADLVAPPTLMRRWVARLPGAEYAEIAEAGHSIAWEQPATFNRLILEFIARQRR